MTIASSINSRLYNATNYRHYVGVTVVGRMVVLYIFNIEYCNRNTDEYMVELF